MKQERGASGKGAIFQVSETKWVAKVCLGVDANGEHSTGIIFVIYQKNIDKFLNLVYNIFREHERNIFRFGEIYVCFWGGMEVWNISASARQQKNGS